MEIIKNLNKLFLLSLISMNFSMNSINNEKFLDNESLLLNGDISIVDVDVDLEQQPELNLKTVEQLKKIYQKKKQQISDVLKKIDNLDSINGDNNSEITSEKNKILNEIKNLTQNLQNLNSFLKINKCLLNFFKYMCFIGCTCCCLLTFCLVLISLTHSIINEYNSVINYI